MHPAAAEWLGSPSRSLTAVANGLGTIYVGLTLVMLSAVGGSILMWVVGAARADISLIRILALLVPVGIIVGAVLNVVGTLMCLATPPETGAQGMIYASAAAMGINLLLTFVQFAVALPGEVALVQWILGIVSGITFLVFLRQMGLFIGRRDLADRARSIIVACVILFGVLVGAIVLIILSAGIEFVQAIAAGQNPGGPVNGGAGLAIGGFAIVGVIIAGLIIFVRYTNLLAALRKAILAGGRR
jgi:hypothetical protein